jgi:hypothetical protein
MDHRGSRRLGSAVPKAMRSSGPPARQHIQELVNDLLAPTRSVTRG